MSGAEESDIGWHGFYPELGKFFGSCGRTEVLETTGLECSPSTLHDTDRVVKKGGFTAADNHDDVDNEFR